MDTFSVFENLGGQSDCQIRYFRTFGVCDVLQSTVHIDIAITIIFLNKICAALIPDFFSFPDFSNCLDQKPDH